MNNLQTQVVAQENLNKVLKQYLEEGEANPYRVDELYKLFMNTLPIEEQKEKQSESERRKEFVKNQICILKASCPACFSN